MEDLEGDCSVGCHLSENQGKGSSRLSRGVYSSSEVWSKLVRLWKVRVIRFGGEALRERIEKPAESGRFLGEGPSRC